MEQETETEEILHYGINGKDRCIQIDEHEYKDPRPLIQQLAENDSVKQWGFGFAAVILIITLIAGMTISAYYNGIEETKRLEMKLEHDSKTRKIWERETK